MISALKKVLNMNTPLETLQQIVYFSIIFAAVLCSVTGSAYGVVSYGGATCDKIRYDGKGAGEVIFDETVHAAKGLTCADCHESHAFTPALFEMKKGANIVTMTRMERGRSCGSCHDVTASNTVMCSKCHHK